MSSSRSSQILALIEALVSPDHLLKSPRLSCLLAKYGAIPLEAIVSHSSFVRLRPSTDEVQQACATSNRYSVYSPPNNLSAQFLIPGYVVNPEVLLIRGARKLGTIEMFGEYITRMLGTDEFTVYAVGDGSDFAVMVPAIDSLFALWRAMAYVPFNGETFLDVEMYSPTLVRVKPPQAERGGKFVRHQSKFEQNREVIARERESTLKHLSMKAQLGKVKRRSGRRVDNVL